MNNEKDKILLVNDNEDYLELLAEIVRDMGYEPVIAVSIKETYEYINWNTKFVAAIVDLYLDRTGEMHGLKIIRDIQMKMPETRVVLSSSTDLGRGDMLAKEAKADMFVGKPLTRDKLKKMFAQLGMNEGNDNAGKD